MRLILRRAFLLFLAVLAAQAAVPTPKSHFGHNIGEDRTLLDWDKVVSYFQALEKSSDRVKFQQIGKTAQGRPMIAVILAAPEVIKNLEHYRDIQKRLADSRRTSETEAEKFVSEGKAVVMITCSIHATEVASTHTAVEFAYRYLTEDRPKFKTTLANTILILVPSLNPDGVDIVTRWYRKTLGTPYEGTSPPELYHAYVGHDNNRDWYIFSQPETRAVVSQLHNAWHPQIVYDVHQQGTGASRIFVPPWMDPIDPNVDPALIQIGNMIGMGMASDLTAAGKRGVAVNAMYDFWIAARHYQAYHGGLRILSESASAKLASPITLTPDDISTNAIGYNPRERSWNYMEPWISGEWHLRDIIDYQLIAWESCLYQAALRRDDMLRNFYRILRRSTERMMPFAFVLPSEQMDPGASKKLLETLQFGAVEVERAHAAFSADGRQYPAGSYIIRMQQPFSAFAKTLLEKQDYPDLRLYPGGPPKRPYDVTAQTLPMLFGVKVDTVKDSFQSPTEKVRDFPFKQAAPLPGALAASDSESWRAINRIWKSKGQVFRDPETGDFYRSARGDSKPVAQPRVGLYRSWNPAMDEGWTRWLLEHFGFSFVQVFNKDIQAGSLRDRFDVLVFPDQQPGTIASGYRKGSMPDEYTGGLEDKGAAALKEFAEAGGRLVFLNHSSDYASSRLALPVKNVVSGVSNRDFYCPGSLLNVTLAKTWLTRGLPSQITIWSEGSPAWEGGDSAIVGRYVPAGVLASGWLLGEKYLAGKAALLDVPSGKGHIILFGMRPQYRAQSYLTFKLLFNALLGP